MNSINNNKKNLINAMLFIFCAIPGIVGLGYVTYIFIVIIFTVLKVNISVGRVLFLIMIMALSSILVLLGTGNLKKWRYGLSLLPIPVIGFISVGLRFVLGNDTSLSFHLVYIVLLFVLVFFIWNRVKYYYKKKKES